MMACQIYQAAERALPGLADDIAAGRFDRLKAWLNEKIHAVGSLHPSADDLMVAVTGQPLDPQVCVRRVMCVCAWAGRAGGAAGWASQAGGWAAGPPSPPLRPLSQPLQPSPALHLPSDLPGLPAAQVQRALSAVSAQAAHRPLERRRAGERHCRRWLTDGHPLPARSSECVLLRVCNILSMETGMGGHRGKGRETAGPARPPCMARRGRAGAPPRRRPKALAVLALPRPSCTL